jgi:hypothetical protein
MEEFVPLCGEGSDFVEEAPSLSKLHEESKSRRAISIVFASRRSKLITQGTLANNILSGGLVKWCSAKLEFLSMAPL